MSESTLNPTRKLFFGLFVFPLLIAVGMALLLCSVVLLTSEKETPETLISGIKSGTPAKRWQKAFELSNELNEKRARGIRDNGLLKEITYILKDAQQYDTKTRSYMAMALSHFDKSDAVPVLKIILNDESTQPELTIAAMWSIGVLGAGDAAADVEKFLTASQPELRQMAAYILGVVGGRSESQKIRPLLNDPANDVRWNAALSLARLGDDSGFDVLKKMTSRQEFQALGMQDSQVETVMINAVKGLTLIQKPESFKILQYLSREDKSLKVRQAAIDAINQLAKI